MGLHNLTPPPDANKNRKRKGRGHSAGQGKTAGKGHKGTKARAGGTVARGFEGGQMPLYRRLPKRGFGNGLFRKEYEIINLGQLEAFDAGTTIDWETLHAVGLVRKPGSVDGVKLLGNGEITRALTVRVHKISASARQKIEAAGGKVEEV